MGYHNTPQQQRREIAVMTRAPFPYDGYYYIQSVNNEWIGVILDSKKEEEYVIHSNDYSEVCEQIATYYGY